MVRHVIAKFLGELLMSILVDLALTALAALFARRRRGRLVSFA